MHVVWLSRSHQVDLPDADSVVATELQCDLQPGALRQKYSLQWRQLLHDSYVLIAEERSFNLTLNVNYSLNGLQYQCKVTIDHKWIPEPLRVKRNANDDSQWQWP